MDVKLQAALMVYKRMKEHKVAPDRMTLSALLGACSKYPAHLFAIVRW
jgi:hypothetical protein